MVRVVLLMIPSEHWAASHHINTSDLYAALWVVTSVPWFSWNESETQELKQK
jgi:hypothetical protein